MAWLNWADVTYNSALDASPPKASKLPEVIFSSMDLFAKTNTQILNQNQIHCIQKEGIFVMKKHTHTRQALPEFEWVLSDVICCLFPEVNQKTSNINSILQRLTSSAKISGQYIFIIKRRLGKMWPLAYKINNNIYIKRKYTTLYVKFIIKLHPCWMCFPLALTERSEFPVILLFFIKKTKKTMSPMTETLSKVNIISCIIHLRKSI